MSKTQQMQREENILQFLLDTTPKFKLKVLELFCLLQHFWEGHQEHLMDGTWLCCEWGVAWAGWGVVLCLCSRPEKIYLVLFWGGCEKGGSNKCRNKRILGICLMWSLFSLRAGWWHLGVIVGKTCKPWRRTEPHADKRQAKTRFVIADVVITI